MAVIATFPYDSSDDETEAGDSTEESGRTALPTLFGSGHLPATLEQNTRDDAVEVQSGGAVWKYRDFSGSIKEGGLDRTKGATTIAPSRRYAYDLRSLFHEETSSTEEEQQSTDDPPMEVTQNIETIQHGRIYEKSGRRLRRGRRRNVFLALGILGSVIIVISLFIGLLNKGRPSPSATPVSDTQARNPAPPVGKSPMPISGLVPTIAPLLPPAPAPSDSPIFVRRPTAQPYESPIVVTNPPSVPTSRTEIYDPDGLSPNDIPQGVVLASNRFLDRGDFVASPSGDYLVGLDQSGNFILEDKSFNIIWSTKTQGADRVYLQSDGNLIVRNANRQALWTSRTYGNDGAVLVVDDSGRIAVMHGSNTVWLQGIPRGTYNGPPAYDLTFPTRGIFYYPWFPETWTVNSKPIKFEPDLGLYSSSNPQVARAHIEAMDYAHIDLSIASWWGPETNLDRARLTMLMDETINMDSNLKWSVYHEDERELQPPALQIRRDLDYLTKWFTWHPSWAHVDGRPVIFVFNGGGCNVVNRWMEASNGEWFVVLKIFGKFKECPRQPDDWHQYGVNGGKPLEYDGYSFSIAPGFWRADEAAPKTPRVSREKWCENTELMAQSDERWHLIVSFNEAGEGTNIEASSHWASDTKYGWYLDCLNKFRTAS